MMHRQVMGREGMLLAIVAALAMLVAAFFLDTQQPLLGDTGICLPSPNAWGMSPLGGWLLNAGIIATLTMALYFLNKEYAFISGSDTVLTGMFLIMTASNPWTSGMLSSSAIIALANVICLTVLFGCYRKHNATQELFVIATILSLGSMIQYAFIFMLPVYLIGAMLMKCFNFKILIAYGMGIVAPYWIAIGMGIIPLEWFSFPTFTNLFDGYESRSGLLIGMLTVALTALIGLILGLNNSVKLYAGNTQRRLYNSVINILGLVCVACMIFDFTNLLAYLVTMYVIVAVQLANLFALWNIPRGSRWLGVLVLLYIGSFVAMLWH